MQSVKPNRSPSRIFISSPSGSLYRPSPPRFFPTSTEAHLTSFPPVLGKGQSVYDNPNANSTTTFGVTLNGKSNTGEIQLGTSCPEYTKAAFDLKRPYALVLTPKWPNRSVAEALWDQDEAHKICEAAGYAPLPHPLCRMLHPRRSNPKFFVSQSDMERFVRRLADLYEGVDDLEHLTMMAIDKERAFSQSEELIEEGEADEIKRENELFLEGQEGEMNEEEISLEDGRDGLKGTATGKVPTRFLNEQKSSKQLTHKKGHSKDLTARDKAQRENNKHNSATNSSNSALTQQDLLKQFISSTLKNEQYMRRKALVPSRYEPPKVVFVNGHISPRQQMHLEVVCSVVDGAVQGRSKQTGLKVIDRDTMILQIFRKRAANNQLTRIQVELAELENMQTQLSIMMQGKTKESLKGVHNLLSSRQLFERDVVVGSYKQAPRSRAASMHGGVIHSFTEDHGLNAKDKERMRWTRKQGQLYEEYRVLQERRHKERMERAQRNTIGVIGYTNAGKSSIVNALTGKLDELEVRNMYFCTTDTKVRTFACGSEMAHVVDTVGFVKNLPIRLYSAFLSTLEELRYCSVILHVHDLTMPFADLKRNARMVRETLRDAGVVDVRDDASLDGDLGEGWAGSWTASKISSKDDREEGNKEGGEGEGVVLELEDDVEENDGDGERDRASFMASSSSEQHHQSPRALPADPAATNAKWGKSDRCYRPNKSDKNETADGRTVSDSLRNNSLDYTAAKHVRPEQDPRVQKIKPASLKIASSVTCRKSNSGTKFVRAKIPIIDVWNKSDVLRQWEEKKGKGYFRGDSSSSSGGSGSGSLGGLDGGGDSTLGVRRLERLQNQYFMSGRGEEAIGFTVPELDDEVRAKISQRQRDVNKISQASLSENGDEHSEEAEPDDELDDDVIAALRAKSKGFRSVNSKGKRLEDRTEEIAEGEARHAGLADLAAAQANLKQAESLRLRMEIQRKRDERKAAKKQIATKHGFNENRKNGNDSCPFGEENGSSSGGGGGNKGNKAKGSFPAGFKGAGLLKQQQEMDPKTRKTKYWQSLDAAGKSKDSRAEYIRYGGGFGGNAAIALHGIEDEEDMFGDDDDDDTENNDFNRLFCLRKPLLDRRRQGFRKPFCVSAHTGEGVEELKTALEEIFRENSLNGTLVDRTLSSPRPSLAGNIGPSGLGVDANNGSTANSEAQSGGSTKKKVPGKSGSIRIEGETETTTSPSKSNWAVDVLNPNQTRKVTVNPSLKECYKYARREGVHVGEEDDGSVVVYMDGIQLSKLEKMRLKYGEYVEGFEGEGLKVGAY